MDLASRCGNVLSDLVLRPEETDVDTSTRESAGRGGAVSQLPVFPKLSGLEETLAAFREKSN